MRGTVLVATQQSGDSERSYSSLLCILLLGFSHETGYVLNSRSVFVVKTERLALKTSLINQNTGISLQACESKHQVFVNTLDFTDSAGVLKLGD